MFAPLNLSTQLTEREVAEMATRIPAMTRVYQAASRDVSRLLASPQKVAALESIERLRSSLLVAKQRLFALSNQAVRAGAITQQQLDAWQAGGLFRIDIALVPGESIESAHAAYTQSEKGMQGFVALLVVSFAAMLAVVGVAVALRLPEVVHALGNSLTQGQQATGDVFAKSIAAIRHQRRLDIEQTTGMPAPYVDPTLPAPFTQTPEQRASGLPIGSGTGSVVGVVATTALIGGGLWWLLRRKTKKGSK